ncbi:small acid-soluble spore protein Tlp [Lentibacillus daqui]|uniref:small acid-soluble spore protein Tlp n=2 Tax=Lentibacillus TaxID=175304 RepID=UPI0022B08885|nr:small acid-soluble spore protein Tlp [Lentibacillus daqui]
MERNLNMADNHSNKPKPDDRSDNAAKLRDAIDNTMENMEEANESMEFSSAEQKQQIKAKNERREEAVKGMRAEIADEEKYEQ